MKSLQAQKVRLLKWLARQQKISIQTADFTFSQEMYPTEEKIDNLKKQALRLLPERIRRETDWHEKELVLKNADVYVLVDGMNDKSAEEKVALEMKI